MMWALAALIWASNGLRLMAPRHPIAGGLHQAMGVAGLVLVAAMAWRWWSGTVPADIDLAWWIMLTGVFARNFITARAARDDRAAAEETA